MQDDADCGHTLQLPLKTDTHVLFGSDVQVAIRTVPTMPDPWGAAASDPTAGYVWPSSRLLADFLETGMGSSLGTKLAGKQVLELGETKTRARTDSPRLVS